MFKSLYDHLKNFKDYLLDYYSEQVVLSTENNLKEVFNQINSNNDIKVKVAKVLATKNLKIEKLEEKLKNHKIIYDPNKLSFTKEEFKELKKDQEYKYNFGEDEEGIISYTLFKYHEYGSGALDIPVTRALFLKMRDMKFVESKEKEDGERQ